MSFCLPSGQVTFTFTTPAAASRFGFSPEGNDIVSRFKDNGAVCNLGASDAVNSCWDALSTSAQTIALRTTGNHPLGTSLTIKFRAASGASNVQPAGNYTATATVTLLAR